MYHVKGRRVGGSFFKCDLSYIFAGMYKQKLSQQQALQKLKQYCAYQERSHSEVTEKLYGYGLYKKEVEAIMAALIEENFLNEERFAIAFAGGKFRVKKWGLVKITYELKQRGVSAYCIKKALTQIDRNEYETVLDELAAEKWRLLRGEKNIFNKKRKTQAYLLQKGFEAALIRERINLL